MGRSDAHCATLPGDSARVKRRRSRMPIHGINLRQTYLSYPSEISPAGLWQFDLALAHRGLNWAKQIGVIEETRRNRRIRNCDGQSLIEPGIFQSQKCLESGRADSRSRIFTHEQCSELIPDFVSFN